MVLATASDGGRPGARTVLLKGADDAGIDLSGIDDLLDRKDDSPDEIDRALASIEGPVI
jgi:hypothetical protein